MTATVTKTVSLTANTPTTVTFAARYNYVEVENYNNATYFVYVRTDGATPVVGGDDSQAVGPLQRVVLANGLPLWYQGGADPGTNPGTVVTLIAATALSVNVQGAG